MLGWTQAQLADEASVSGSFVVDVEAGKPTVEASKLMDVLQPLGFETALREREPVKVRW